MKVRRILVPLDGSPFAEQILPFAVRLARISQSELLLLRLTRLGTFVPNEVENELECIKKAQTYLDEVGSIITNPTLPLHLDGNKVRTTVVYDEPLREIPDIAAYEMADLIMMTTHGRNGLSRLLMGSASANIVHNSKLPIIILRPQQSKEVFSLETALANEQPENKDPVVLTLDGSVKAELVIEPAVAVAKLLGVAINLVHAIYYETVATYSMYYEYADTETAHKEAEEFLTKVQNQIEAKGVRCQIAIREGIPATRILEYAENINAQILAISTHAHTNAATILLGSVAESLIRHSNKPILLVNMNRYAPANDEATTTATPKEVEKEVEKV